MAAESVRSAAHMPYRCQENKCVSVVVFSVILWMSPYLNFFLHRSTMRCTTMQSRNDTNLVPIDAVFPLPSVLLGSFNSSLGPRRALLGRRNILLGCCLLWVSSGVLGGSTGRVFVGRLALQLEATPDPRALELVGHAQSVRNGVGRSLDAEVMTRTSDNGKSEWRALQNAAMYAFRTSISIQQQEEE